MSQNASEFSIDQLLEGIKPKEQPRAPRVRVNVPIFIEVRKQMIKVNLVDLSAKGLKIDKEFSISEHEPCRIIFRTTTALDLVCLPIIGSKEFNRGTWDRLLIKSTFNFDKLISLLTK